MYPEINAKRFPAKLLLFGEHVLLCGATALAVPVEAFGGMWKMDGREHPYQARMLEFADSEALKSVQGIDHEQFKRDLAAGLYFDSDIPGGYGLGSSGALCAAIYERYVADKTEDYAELKQIFARMEGFFHGSSSGIDPLTSYTGAGILIRNKTNVEKAVMAPWPDSGPTVFLLDSELPRHSGPLIAWFLEQMEQEVFARKLEAEYLPAHETAIKSWMEAKKDSFWPALRLMSAFQFAHMTPMIPESLKSLWERSLPQEDFILKICGAGGGGYVLGFARNKTVIEGLAKKYPLIYPFKARQNPENVSS